MLDHVYLVLNRKHKQTNTWHHSLVARISTILSQGLPLHTFLHQLTYPKLAVHASACQNGIVPYYTKCLGFDYFLRLLVKKLLSAIHHRKQNDNT